MTAPTAVETNLEQVPYAAHVAQAEQQFETGRAKLYRHDGQQIYGPEEHQQREQELLERFDSALSTPMAIVERDAADAEAALQAVQRDPIERLDPANLARANGLHPFMAEDFASQPLERLIDRARTALAAKAPAELALVARYGRMRVEAEQAKHPATAHTGDGVELRGGHPQAQVLAAFSDAIRQIEAALVPADLQDKTAAAAKARKDLQALRGLAGNTRRKLDGSAARQERDMRAWFGL